MRSALALLGAFAAALPAMGEEVWEVRGEPVTIESAADVLVLRLADGRELRVPLAAMSAASQAAARRAVDRSTAVGAAPAPTSADSTAAADRAAVPDAIKAVEADAVRCRTAAEAADVYRLFLAGGDRSADARSAATERLRHWSGLAEQGMVRIGGRFVPPEEARTAARAADEAIGHAIELMRLGNAELAEEELRKAGRSDPESGRAAFVTGLSYALVARQATKALEQFADAVRRDPDDAAALNNLAVTEFLARRHAAAVDHLRAAIAAAGDPQPVADNVAWAVKVSASAKTDPRLRMPAKAVNDLNELYRDVTQGMKLKPSDSIAAPQLLGPDGKPCTASSLGELARVVSMGWPTASTTRCLGIVIAPGRVVCPRQAVVGTDGGVAAAVMLEVATDRARRYPAKVIAAPEAAGAALLECAALDLPPLRLAETWPADSVIEAVSGSVGAWLGGDFLVARGKASRPPAGAEDGVRFLHNAVLPRGLGGGPICDGEGRVLGMVAATPPTEASGNGGGFGLPMAEMLTAFAEHLPAGTGDQPAPEPVAGGGRGLAGTVVVSVTRSPVSAGATPPP